MNGTLFKNVASQKAAVWAWDRVNGVPKTGDAANITAQISKDGGASAATGDTNPTELDATDHPGIYLFDLTQAETNANLITITPSSGTANIVFQPMTYLFYTQSNYDTPMALITSARMTELDVGTAGKMAYQLDKMMIALVNKKIVTKASGNIEQFSDADVSLGTIAGGIASDATTATQLRLVI